ncbi:MAG: hypothetical protein CTY16_12065 [Methylobacter sp.]|nr:MAG: hypothetical protein CTY16_12065 [Methylobacter sp.]
MTTSEVERRARLALDAIVQAFGTTEDEFGATMFVKHHLEEIPQSYWQQHLGANSPEPTAIIGLLELFSNWGDNDIENFDFSLPGNVTDYVISVHFNSTGKIDGISMES